MRDLLELSYDSQGWLLSGEENLGFSSFANVADTYADPRYKYGEPEMVQEGSFFSDNNPFDFESGREVKVARKTKKRKMASIHQFAALSNITTAATARDSSGFGSPDKDLYELGVRPGQVWAIPYASKSDQYLSFVGYHKKGFLMLSIRARDESPIPPVSLFRYPRKMKQDLLTNIASGDATMLSSVIQSLVDKTGNAKPGRELDVTLSALMMHPAYWRDSIRNKDYFLSICDKGHYRTTEWYSPLGGPCDSQCEESQDSHVTAAMLDTALCMIYYGKTANRRYKFSHSEQKELSRAFVPFSIIETRSETQRILTANRTEIPRSKVCSDEIDNDWRRQTADWLTKAGARSGHVYKVGRKNRGSRIEKLGYARLHKRECGNFHVELSRNAIFSGDVDSTLVQDMISTREAVILLSKKDSTPLDQNYPFVRCDCCDFTRELLISFSSSTLSRQKRVVYPVEVKVSTTEKAISVGEIVLYQGKPAVYYKKVKSKEGSPARAMLVTEKGRVTTVPPHKLKYLPPLPELINQFFDDDMLLRKRFNPYKWHSIVTVGSRLRLRSGERKSGKAELSGQLVTVAEPPSRVGEDYGAKVLECEGMINLRTEVLPNKVYPVAEKAIITYKDNDYEVHKIESGMATLVNADKDRSFLPEPALHILLNRGIATMKQVYTVENLLSE